MSPNAWVRGAGEGVAGSQPMSTDVHCTHGAQINFRDLTPYLAYAYKPLQIFSLCAITSQWRLFCLKLYIEYSICNWSTVLHELDTVNVKINYNMIKCAEANYIYEYIYKKHLYVLDVWLRHSGSQNLRNNSPFFHTIDNHIENEIK